MAQASAGISRLPDIAKCIAGNDVLLSWDNVLTALLSHEEPPSDLYRQFFAANHSLLSQASPSFPPPSPASKSEFDRAVAATGGLSAEQQKELEQIKNDAIWLSHYVKLDEVESLRIALLEWQNSPESRLNAGFTDAEIASLRDAVGAEHAQSLDLNAGGQYSRIEEDFDFVDARKARLLQSFYRSHVSITALARETFQSTIVPSDPEDLQSQWYSLLDASAHYTLKDAVAEITRSTSALAHELIQFRKWEDFSAAFGERLEFALNTCKLQCVAVQLQILLLRAHTSNETVTGKIMEDWLQFCSNLNHFSHFQSELPVQQDAVELIQSTATYITLALIQPIFAMGFLDDPAIADAQQNQTGTHYFLDHDRIGAMYDLMNTAARSAIPSVSPAVLAWGLIFYKIRVRATDAKSDRDARNVQKAIDRSWSADHQTRRFSGSSIGSTGESIFESIISQIHDLNSGADALEVMLRGAVRDCNVFQVISDSASAACNLSPLLASLQLQILQELLATARPELGYTPDLLTAQLAVLSAGSTLTTDKTPFQPLVNFIGNRFLTDNFLDTAARRFPYEALPFLRISTLLAKAGNEFLFREDGVHYITQYLQSMESFTQTAVGGFEAYHTTQEDQNADLVRLDRAVGMLDYRPTRLLTSGGHSGQQIAVVPGGATRFLTSSGHRDQQIAVVPEGATGTVITEAHPPVILWNHKYSSLSLIGKWLDLHVKGHLTNIVSPFETADDVATAVLGLLSSLLSTTYSSGIGRLSLNDARQLCEDILSEASALLESDRDVVDCIFDLIEQQLVSTRRFSPDSGCELLAACVDVLTVLCKVRPIQLWPLLVKSSALAAHGAKRSIFALVSSVEVPTQAFPLLQNCGNLLRATIDLVLAVSTHSEVGRGLRARSNPSQRPLAAAILGLTENMYAAFETIGSWSFIKPKQKQSITSTLCDAFSDILYRSFGTGASANTDSNITGCYRPAADFLLNALSGTGVQSLGSGPIALNLVSRFLETPPPALTLQRSSDIRSLLSLARVHLGSSRLSAHALKEVSTTLVNLFPIYARLPLLHANLLRPCLALECDILDAFKPGSVPHLLSHLGSRSSLAFIDSLKYLNARAPEEAHITWRLISRLMSLDQRWTAVILITGSPPGRERKGQDSPILRTRGKPLLEQALDKLVDIKTTHPTVSVALLQLLTEAQQSWPSVTDAITARRELFPSLVEYVSTRQSYSSSDVGQAVHNQVAAGVTDLSVISLHAMSFRSRNNFTAFAPLIDWLTNNALKVAAYNASMHANLKKNFAMKYNGLDLDVVKRTGILRVPYGTKYYYDLEFASQILGEDAHWNKGSQSFYAELERANTNFSVVDSEMILLRSFKYLCSEHGMFFARDIENQIPMSRIIDICLKANTSPAPSEALFDTLALTRLEIAVLVLGPLVTVGAEGPDFTALLRSAYSTSRERSGSYQNAVLNDDLVYWRAMLNVIRLCMQFHATKSLKRVGVKAFESINPNNILFCEIAAHIVGEGLGTVVTTLQDQKQDTKKRDEAQAVNATDVLLLLNIFQTMLRLPSLPQFSSQLSDALISTGTPQSLLLLFSWSHLLDETPVYGVLAARFLAAISKLGPIAEELAVEGVFNRLLIAKTSQRIQSLAHGAGHIDQRPNAAMLYQIWSDGFLRITLNLLDAIGGGVAVEAAGFINAFPQQLNRASLSFSTSPNRVSGSEGLTLGAACELASLSLVSFVLDRFRLAGASSAVDSTQITTLVEFDEHKTGIAADLKDVLDQELQFRLRREVPTNEGEMVWARTKVGAAENGNPSQTVLDKKIMKELQDARTCLLPDGEE